VTPETDAQLRLLRCLQTQVKSLETMLVKVLRNLAWSNESHAFTKLHDEFTNGLRETSIEECLARKSRGGEKDA
jgi:hypothetical protein